MAIIGGDAPALFNFASQLVRRRRRITEITVELGRLVESAEWVGPDRDRFVETWSGTHARGLMSIVDELGLVADRVVVHARQQEETSQ